MEEKADKKAKSRSVVQVIERGTKTTGVKKASKKGASKK